jgi:hypothetical protein
MSRTMTRRIQFISVRSPITDAASGASATSVAHAEASTPTTLDPMTSCKTQSPDSEPSSRSMTPTSRPTAGSWTDRYCSVETKPDAITTPTTTSDAALDHDGPRRRPLRARHATSTPTRNASERANVSRLRR